MAIIVPTAAMYMYRLPLPICHYLPTTTYLPTTRYSRPGETHASVQPHCDVDGGVKIPTSSSGIGIVGDPGCAFPPSYRAALVHVQAPSLPQFSAEYSTYISRYTVRNPSLRGEGVLTCCGGERATRLRARVTVDTWRLASSRVILNLYPSAFRSNAPRWIRWIPSRFSIKSPFRSFCLIYHWRLSYRKGCGLCSIRMSVLKEQVLDDLPLLLQLKNSWRPHMTMLISRQRAWYHS